MNPRLWFPLGLVVIIGAVLFAAEAGSILVVSRPQPSDLILVLAGETDRRPALAVELLDHGYAPRIMMDVPADTMIYQISQRQLAEQYIQSLPQRNSIAICPIVGLSTRDESHDVEKCLDHQQASRILIVTSDFHTRRALSVLRHELPSHVFSVAAAHDDAQFGTRWWTHRQWAKTCFEEWLRLFWWNAIDRWR